MQDYPTTDQLCKIIGPKTAFRWMQKVEALVRVARFVDTTSYPMGEDIARRTGRRSTQMLHEGLEFADFARLSQPTVPQHNQSLTLAFAGTVVEEDAFAKFIHALDNIRKTFAKPILLELFSSHNYAGRPWFNPSWMSEHGYKNRGSLIDSLQSCHAGLVVMETEEVNRNYNRFSFPTKFITYIAAGIEPLVLGHSSSAVSTLARQSGIGIQINDTCLLEEALKSLMKDELNSQKKRRHIITFARSHFDAAQKRRQFHCQMLEIAGCA
jgi:glycosyltransferase involved in cell wall biosynthesis